MLFRICILQEEADFNLSSLNNIEQDQHENAEDLSDHNSLDNSESVSIYLVILQINTFMFYLMYSWLTDVSSHAKYQHNEDEFEH